MLDQPAVVLALVLGDVGTGIDPVRGIGDVGLAARRRAQVVGVLREALAIQFLGRGVILAVHGAVHVPVAVASRLPVDVVRIETVHHRILREVLLLQVRRQPLNPRLARRVLARVRGGIDEVIAVAEIGEHLRAAGATRREPPPFVGDLRIQIDVRGVHRNLFRLRARVQEHFGVRVQRLELLDGVVHVRAGAVSPTRVIRQNCDLHRG